MLLQRRSLPAKLLFSSRGTASNEKRLWHKDGGGRGTSRSHPPSVRPSVGRPEIGDVQVVGARPLLLHYEVDGDPKGDQRPAARRSTTTGTKPRPPRPTPKELSASTSVCLSLCPYVFLSVCHSLTAVSPSLLPISVVVCSTHAVTPHDCLSFSFAVFLLSVCLFLSVFLTCNVPHCR